MKRELGTRSPDAERPEGAGGKLRAGAIPYRRRPDGAFEFLIITAESGSGRWVLPKGKIDEGDSAIETVVKETMEETGASGNLDPNPFIEYDHREGKEDIAMYLFEVTGIDEKWDEENLRERRWVTAVEAPEILKWEPLSEVLEKADEHLRDNLDAQTQ